MINWETIKSLYDDKPTLLQWLKKVEAALAASVLQVVDVEKVSTSEIKLNFVFEDGTNIETPTIALPYEIQNVAIVNGHLILTLESGETLDAGNLGGIASLSVNASQHLIVTYQDGTTDDLGSVVARLENIEDAQGHKRFQEWNLSTPSVAGLNITYAKASLSGTHFMFVVAGNVEAGSTIAPYSTLAYLSSLPAWIYDKIVAIYGNRIEQRTIPITNEDDTSSSMLVSFNKVSPSNLFLQTSYSSSSYTKNGNFRIQFDLLIDNA